MANTTRYQLRLTGTAQQLLSEMCAKLEASPKDVILDALAVFHFAIEASEKGQKVGALDPETNTFTNIVTPSLQRMRKQQLAGMGASG